MQRFRQVLGSVPIVVITAYGDLSTAVAAVRNGAFDYVTKPLDPRTAEHTIRGALAARAIHRHSRRADRPFVAINLASLSSSLAASELFGHARGAFTGAEHARRGLLAQADGGVVFLDEVADIPMPATFAVMSIVARINRMSKGLNHEAT